LLLVHPRSSKVLRPLWPRQFKESRNASRQTLSSHKTRHRLHRSALGLPTLRVNLQADESLRAERVAMMMTGTLVAMIGVLGLRDNVCRTLFYATASH
jgi:hypothetical protein